MQVICPLCGTAHGERARERYKVRSRTGRIYTYARWDMENYWERMLREYDDDKPFAVVHETGRGKFKNFKYISFDDPLADPYRAYVGELVLRVLRNFLRKGIITVSQVEEILDEIRGT